MPRARGRDQVRHLFMIEIGDRLAERAFIQHGFLIDQPCHQRCGTDLVDATRNPFGVFEDALDRIIGEERAGGVTGDAHLVFDVANRQIGRASCRERV